MSTGIPVKLKTKKAHSFNITNCVFTADKKANPEVLKLLIEVIKTNQKVLEILNQNIEHSAPMIHIQ